MPIYKYKAKDKKGLLTEGTITAFSESEVESIVKDRDLELLTIRLEKKRMSTFSGGGFPIGEKISLCRYLSLVINSGVPLSEGLDLLSGTSTNSTVKHVIEDIASSTRRGVSLYESFSKYRDYFGEVFLVMVKTGETAGTLSESFGYLSHQFQQEKDLRQKVLSALLYPLIIIGLMFVIGIVVFTFVLPRLVQVFSRMDVDLPFYTRMLFGMSDFFQKNMIGVGIFIALLAISGVLVIKSRAGKDVVFQIFLKTPLIKRVILEYNLVRFTQSLSALLKSGVPVTESIELSLHALSFIKTKDLSEQFSKKITQGEPLSKIFSEAKIFPPLMIQLVTVGERTGSLEKTLTDLAEFYEQEVENSLKNFIAVLEPALMIMVGIGVGAMVVSVISPIYGLIGQMQGGS